MGTTRKIKTANYTAPTVAGADMEAYQQELQKQYEEKIISQDEEISRLNQQVISLSNQNSELIKEIEDLRQQLSVAPQAPVSTTATTTETKKNGFLLTAGLAIAALVIVNN